MFELKHLTGAYGYEMKLDCIYPCASEDIELVTESTTDWQTVRVPLSLLTSKGLDITKVNTGLVIWAKYHNSNHFRIDDVRFEPSS